MSNLRNLIPQTHPGKLNTALVGLCALVIFLQGADAVSTFIALDTGHLVERNALLNRISSHMNLPIKWVVLLAKATVSALFIVVMIKTKATKTNLALLVCFATFYVHVVSENFYWINVVDNIPR